MEPGCSTTPTCWSSTVSFGRSAPRLPAPAGAQTVDGTGKTLLPGLIDAHTHTIDESSLLQALVFGVTTDLDMFCDPGTAASIKKHQAEGKLLDYADLRSSGYLATAPGGHGTEYGLTVPTLSRPEEAQAWVDARIGEGSDYIKLIYDDGLAYGLGRHLPTLNEATLKALAEAAHRRGKLVVTHIATLPDAITAIDAGTDGLAHLFVGPASAPGLRPDRRRASHLRRSHAHRAEYICAREFDAELADDPRIEPYLLPSESAAMKGGFSLPAKPSCRRQ